MSDVVKTQVKRSGIQKYLRQCAERKKMGVLTTGYLMVNSWTDWRRKEVDIVWTVAVFVLTAFIYVGTDQKLCWSGLLPGICLWLASLWRSDQIGSGDGIVLMGSLSCGKWEDIFRGGKAGTASADR